YIRSQDFVQHKILLQAISYSQKQRLAVLFTRNHPNLSTTASNIPSARIQTANHAISSSAHDALPGHGDCSRLSAHKEPAIFMKTASKKPLIFRLRMIGWLMGPALLAMTILLPAPGGMSVSAWHTAGIALLLAA